MNIDTVDLVAEAQRLLQVCSSKQLAQLVRLISPVPNCGLMSPTEFERVIVILTGQSRRRAFSTRSIQAARLVLVMGASVAEAAADTGLARQVVHRLMARIRARMESLPGTWVKVEAWLPADAAQTVIDLAESLKAAHLAVE